MGHCLLPVFVQALSRHRSASVGSQHMSVESQHSSVGVGNTCVNHSLHTEETSVSLWAVTWLVVISGVCVIIHPFFARHVHTSKLEKHS